ncbi:unnamed protein product [Effrenium voratum]|uniref:Uncharacterized protein n=1 Tax=Effrenium voratum TaxID=2562239 RepID=A0AA36INS4_9DINO|nr:unnamed protein product [Effrenium voratum]
MEWLLASFALCLFFSSLQAVVVSLASTQAGVFVEAAVPSPENGGGAGVELLQGVLFAKHAIYFKISRSLLEVVRPQNCGAGVKAHPDRPGRRSSCRSRSGAGHTCPTMLQAGV